MVQVARAEWIGNGWVRVARGQAEHDSVLAREKMIALLQKEIAELSKEEVALTSQIEQARGAVDAGEQEIQVSGTELNAMHRKRSEVDGKLSFLNREPHIGYRARIL